MEPRDEELQIDSGVQGEADTESESTDASEQVDGAASDADSSGQADLASQSDQLAHRETALQTELGELRRQLGRMESRFDRGGESAAAVRALQSKIDGLEGRLGDIGELRETVDLVLQRSMDPEEWEQYQAGRRVKATQRELDKTRAERDALLLNRVDVGGSRQAPQAAQAQQESGITPEVRALAVELDEACRDAGFDPNDAAFQSRVKAAVPNLTQLDPNGVFRAISRALVKFQREDHQAERDTVQRSAARGAVQTDRATSRTGKPRYATLDDAEAAFARDEISPAEFRALRATLA